MIMNSCKSTVLSAWTPPFNTFIMGTGIVLALTPPRYRYSGIPCWAAQARATARDAPRTALAPKRDLFSVPSASRRIRSMLAWQKASSNISTSAITVFTYSTAFFTPFP